MLESTSFLEKQKCTKIKGPKSEELCPNIMNFFKLLEEMETKKISEKSGRCICRGPIGSKIEYAYCIKFNQKISARLKKKRNW
jgi:hypothetical protein